MRPAPELTLYVDPSCPFAWTAHRWAGELRDRDAARVHLGLVSLSVVNEHKELSDSYRAFNDQAWGPARVGAAVHQRYGAEAFETFYAAYGERRHVQQRRDGDLLADAVAGCGLGEGVLEAACDESLDDALRAWTARALEPVQADVGTPIVHLEGGGFFGPVLTAAPRGDAAVQMLHALQVLAANPDLVEVKRGRTRPLRLG